MEKKEYLEKLLNKYLDKQCTAEEVRYLLSHFNLPDQKEELQDMLHQYFEQEVEAGNVEKQLAEQTAEELRPVLLSKIRKKQPRYLIGKWIKLVAAAVVFLCVSVALYVFIPSRSEIRKETVQSAAPQKDIQPGSNKAILLLANGSKIILNEVKDGELARQNGVAIVKTKNGQLLNTSLSSASADTEMAYNTISTPRGGQYQVILPDGSRVWLNAASSLRYPAAFTGQSRLVELTGEAYFEVSKDASKPFKVSARGQMVEVLGTHFNMNTYEDEQSMKTTLLEGSIQIAYQQMKSLLRPGDQAKITAGQAVPLKISRGVDTDEAVAWKEGYFQFNHANIQEVMRQLSRWYDIEVKYEGKQPSKEFGGAIQKDLPLSKVLNILEKSNVHFKVSGKEVVVMP
ncbi:FecR family protein [Pedobacter sp. HMWF019]|uniref:FecR family protein n=1 Tax=Pedobacter sp. HMWF019 TaxID=2056856 RepID=UPI0011B25021|nr:FecR family protein [Pedobacter sp. HMWF019]